MSNIKSYSKDWESLVLEINMGVVGDPANIADYGDNNDYNSQYPVNLFGEYEVMINSFQTSTNYQILQHAPQVLMLVSPQLNSTYGNRPYPIYCIGQNDAGGQPIPTSFTYNHVGADMIYRSVFSGYLNLFVGEITLYSGFVPGQTTLPAPGIPNGISRAYLTLLLRKVGRNPL